MFFLSLFGGMELEFATNDVHAMEKLENKNKNKTSRSL